MGNVAWGKVGISNNGFVESHHLVAPPLQQNVSLQWEYKSSFGLSLMFIRRETQRVIKQEFDVLLKDTWLLQQLTVRSVGCRSVSLPTSCLLCLLFELSNKTSAVRNKNPATSYKWLLARKRSTLRLTVKVMSHFTALRVIIMTFLFCSSLMQTNSA